MPTDYPSCPLPLLPEEVVRARAEDLSFAEVLGRARAKARSVEYDPTIHHPNAPRSGIHDRVRPEDMEAVRETIDRWNERGGGRRNPYLRAI